MVGARGIHGQRALHRTSLACDSGDHHLPSGGRGSLQVLPGSPGALLTPYFLRICGREGRHQMQAKNIKMKLCSWGKPEYCVTLSFTGNGWPLVSHEHIQQPGKLSPSETLAPFLLSRRRGAWRFPQPTQGPASWASSRGTPQRRGSKGQPPWAAGGGGSKDRRLASTRSQISSQI